MSDAFQYRWSLVVTRNRGGAQLISDWTRSLLIVVTAELDVSALEGSSQASTRRDGCSEKGR